MGEEGGEGEAEPVAARGVEGVETSAAVGARVAEEEEAEGGGVASSTGEELFTIPPMDDTADMAGLQ